jgi:hypothetical protein
LKEYIPQHEERGVLLVMGMQRCGMSIFDEGQGYFKNDTCVFARWGLVQCVLLLGEWEDAVCVGLEMSHGRLVETVLSRYTGRYDWIQHVLDMEHDNRVALLRFVVPFVPVTLVHLQFCVTRQEWECAMVLLDYCEETHLRAWVRNQQKRYGSSVDVDEIGMDSDIH